MLDSGSDLDAQEQHHLRAACDGDTVSFEWLYRRHVGRVYGLCLRMTADPSLAEECTQRAFIRAWTRLREFRGESRLTTWLHRIAVNEVLGCYRNAGRDRAMLVSVAHEDESEGQAVPDAGDALDIEEAIARLPTGARHVFVLIAIHGYTHDEAGALLGIAGGTCKAQYHRARRLLAERLDVRMGEGTHA